MPCDLDIGTDRITRQLFYIPERLRSRHGYVIGRTGKGKSTLLHRMVHQDIKQPYATVVFDAGDLATSLLETFPEEVIASRVRFFSLDYPIPYNPLLRRRDEPGRLENELFGLMDQVTVESSATAPLTARMKRVLSLALRAVLKEQAEPTLSTLTTYLLEHKSELRKGLELREDEFTIAFEGVIDRLAQFLRDARIRRIVCAPHELNFDEIIDNGEILLVSLAGLEKPLVRFLGTLLFHGLAATIMERPAWARKDVALYIDEFQDYISSLYAVANFQTLFAQGRRYQISLTVAHQDFGTIDSRLLHTIHANAGTVVAFSCGPDEAKRVSDIFSKEYQPETVGFLPDYSAIARVGESVAWCETYPAPEKLREVLPGNGANPQDDPPDPLEEFTNRHADRDPYRDARKPRRSRTVSAPEESAGYPTKLR